MQICGCSEFGLLENPNRQMWPFQCGWNGGVTGRVLATAKREGGPGQQDLVSCRKETGFYSKCSEKS